MKPRKEKEKNCASDCSSSSSLVSFPSKAYRYQDCRDSDDEFDDLVSDDDTKMRRLKTRPHRNCCYICGVVGYEELLASCTKCTSSSIHAYCLKTVQFTLPEDWVCEDCHESPKQVARKFTGEVLMLKRPVKLIPTDEAFALAATHLPQAKGKRHLASPEKVGKKVESSKKGRENLRNMVPPATSPRKYDMRAHYPGGDLCKDPLRATKSEVVQRQSDEQLTIDSELPNHPASRATWKGSFRTSGFSARVSSCDVIWGFPPGKVGRKVLEFSEKMPCALHFDEVPRCTVWEKLFNGGSPDIYDIGLYFMPIGDRSEQCYSCLVSHLEKQDVVLTSCISGIQLLVFSSSHLDEKSQKINQAYYLCGLFVPAAKPAVGFKEPEQNQHIVENEETEEMEIDMVGGAPVGKIDVPVPRDSNLCCCTTSKAASSVRQPVCKVQVKAERYDGSDFDSSVCKVQVKPEKYDGSDFASALVEPKVPPGFEEIGRLKYKSIAELLQSGDGNRI